MSQGPDDQNPVEDFASLLAEYEKQHGGAVDPRKKKRGPTVGDAVKGRIVGIGNDAVFVDLGGKSEGTLELSQVRGEDGSITVQVGDEIEARVVSTEEGQVILRRTFGKGAKGSEKASELQQAFEHGIPVEGVVSAVNKGGVEVQIAGMRAFCPISQLAERHIEDASEFVGQRLQFRITRYEADRKGRENIVVSRRALLEEEAEVRAVETRTRLAIGAVLDGRVSSLKEYGAFIDLGGIEGMLHISELGFSRVAHPKDVLTVGQQVSVQIIRMEKSDDPRRPEKISLSLKSLEKDPWNEARERFPEGSRVKGKIMRVEQFGAFVELVPGIEGLVHVSELGAGGKNANARQVVKIGQEVEVTVLGVDPEKRRISLSMNAPDIEDAEDAALRASAAKAPIKSFGTFGDLLKGAGATPAQGTTGSPSTKGQGQGTKKKK